MGDLNLMGINPDTRDLLGFADVFFDGFLSDVLMQHRIKKAIAQVDRATDCVRSLICRPERM